MSIQQNINQTISLAGLLAAQTEAYKIRGKQAALDKELKTTDKQIGVAADKGPQNGAEFQSLASLEAIKAELLHQKYRNNPSVKAYGIYQIQVQRAKEAEEIAQGVLDEEAFKAEEARKAAAEKEAWAAQREQEEGIDFENILASNTPVENWETSPAAVARQTAERELSLKQQEMRETRARQNGFTSQRFGTTKTKVNFNKGGK